MKQLILLPVFFSSVITIAQPTPWIPVGPDPQHSISFGTVSGRVIAIAVANTYTEAGITKPAAMFIAVDGGGVWRSINFEGIIPTWTPVLDDFFPEAKDIFSIAVSANNPKQVYAGAANGNIFHSADGGDHWEKIITGAATNGTGNIIKIILHPVTDQIYFATQYTNDASTGYTLGGVWRQVTTTNTFTQINTGLTDKPILISDLDYTIDQQANLTLYLGTTPATGKESFSTRGIWRFRETTGQWTRLPITLKDDLSSGVIIAGEFLGTVRLACDHHPGAALGIYAAIVNTINSSLLNVYKLVNEIWTPVGTPIKNLSTTFSAFAALVMGLSPTGELYIGCGNVPDHSVFQSTDGGGHWSSVRQGTNGLRPHNDERSVCFYNGKFYLGDDGGINRFNPLPSFRPGRNTWESLNTKGLQTIGVNGIALHPTNPGIMLCGSQDNALALLNSGVWTERFGDDNSKVLFDPDPASPGQKAYTTGVDHYDFFFRSDDGGATWNDKSPEDANADEGHQAAHVSTYAPFAIHPANPNRIIVGIDRIYETFDKGDHWGKQKSPIFSPDDKRADGRPFGHASTAIAYGYNDRIWVAYEQQIFVTENDGGDGTMNNWRDVSLATGFGGKIMNICVDPRNHDNVYLASYNGSIWKSQKTATGWNWNNLPMVGGGGLNKLLLVTPNYLGSPLLFAGTNTGLFYTNDEGVSWWPLNNGLPKVVVNDIQYSPLIFTMICGVYGRGVYKNAIGALLNKETQPSLIINYPKDDCNIPPIEGTIIPLSFTLKNPVDNDPFTILWKITGANNITGETFMNAKCKIEIPIPAPVITATVEITYKGGIKIVATKVIPTVSQELAGGLTFFCKYRHEHLKPIPWWEWDPARWRFDPKTNVMVVRPMNRKELSQEIKNTQIYLRSLQQMMNGIGK
jgi:photosystem II stability/assembly factor-like uncharacterized protein